MLTQEIQSETGIGAGQQLSEAQIAKRVADQNDMFRKAVTGTASGPDIPLGRVVMTSGISDRSPEFQSKLIAAVADYDDFNTDCDPHGWHEMGVVEIEGETVWLKIDLYDENYEYGSSDPANMAVTRRVLTLLLPSEY